MIKLKIASPLIGYVVYGEMDNVTEQERIEWNKLTIEHNLYMASRDFEQEECDNQADFPSNYFGQVVPVVFQDGQDLQLFKELGKQWTKNAPNK